MLWRLGLIALLFEERASFFQQAISFGLILLRQCVPNLLQPGCEFQFHAVSFSHARSANDQVFTVLNAEAKGISGLLMKRQNSGGAPFELRLGGVF